MKNFTLFGFILIAIQASSCASYSQSYSDPNYQDKNSNSSNQDNSYQDGQDICYQTFYDDLSPYGQWVNNLQYGYVWSPKCCG